MPAADFRLRYNKGDMMKRGDGTVKAMAMSFVVGAISFFTGTIFAPEIQP